MNLHKHDKHFVDFILQYDEKNQRLLEVRLRICHTFQPNYSPNTPPGNALLENFLMVPWAYRQCSPQKFLGLDRPKSISRPLSSPAIPARSKMRNDEQRYFQMNELNDIGRGMMTRRTCLNIVYCHLEWDNFQKLLKHGAEEGLTWSAVMFCSWFTRVNRPAEPQDAILSSCLTVVWLKRSDHSQSMMVEIFEGLVRYFQFRNQEGYKKRGDHTFSKLKKDTCLPF